MSAKALRSVAAESYRLDYDERGQIYVLFLAAMLL
jgi:hypothetical protein